VKIGFHLPIAKGFEHTYQEAKRLGCDVIQIFVKNPRSWVEKSWSGEDREAFGRSLRDLPVVAHLSYLPNIARSDEEPKHLAGFLHEAKLCAELGIETMVVHCGSRESIEKGLDAAAWSVEQVLDAYPVSVLLENAAGQGKAVGKTLSELAALRARVRDASRVGFCLDTAHLFRLAVENAPAGSRLHAVSEEGVTTKAIATTIGEHLGLPIVSISREAATGHFGFLAGLFQVDAPTSNAITRRLVGWQPSEVGLLTDLQDDRYYNRA
jgi:apurinic endonuclease APN1